MTRTLEEHIAFCKARALRHVDAGDLGQAVTSMLSDIRKHPETHHVDLLQAYRGMTAARDKDVKRVRSWIDGFH